MAAIGKEVELTMKELEQEITCGVCQQFYNDPKILPCLHYYCKECVLNLALKNGRDKPFICPECRKFTKLPEGNESNLKTAFFVNRFKSMYKRQRKVCNKIRFCDFCHSPDFMAESFCLQCEKFACKNCVNMHSVMRGIFENHEMVFVDDLKKKKPEELAAGKLAPQKCPSHEELLNIFCLDCTTSVCRDCIVKGHRGHMLEFTKDLVKEKKAVLTEKLKLLQDVRQRLNRCLEDVHLAENEVTIQGDSAVETIETWFKAFYRLLKTRRNSILDDVKGRMKRKLDTLKRQEENLSSICNKIQQVVDCTEKYMRYSSEEELVKLCSDLTNQLKQVEQLGEKVEREEYEPMADADMGLEMAAEASFEKILEKTKVTTLPISMEVNQACKTTVINKEFHLPVEISLSNRSPVYRNINLECQVKRAQGGVQPSALVLRQGVSTANQTPVNENTQVKTVPAIIQSKVRWLRHGKYLITFTTEEKGQYELNFSADGVEMKNLFSITAFKHPDEPLQVQKPTTTWYNVMHPKCLAHTSKRDIIAVEHEKGLVVFDQRGSILNKIKLKIQDLTVDDENNVIMVDYNSANISMLTSTVYLYSIKVYEVNQVNGPGHIGVATYKEEVMVTECGNAGSIIVYNKQFKLVRRIQGRGEATLRHLRPDCHGNLYVTSEAKTVQVLSREGDYLRTIGHDTGGQLLLKDPWMLCVFTNFVYVTDAVLGRTLMFTNEGTHIATFGCYGGVSVDSDGLVCLGNFYQDQLYFY